VIVLGLKKDIKETKELLELHRSFLNPGKVLDVWQILLEKYRLDVDFDGRILHLLRQADGFERYAFDNLSEAIELIKERERKIELKEKEQEQKPKEDGTKTANSLGRVLRFFSRNSRQDQAYVVKVECVNCGSPFGARIPKGILTEKVGLTCPFCGVTGSTKNGRFKNNGISTQEKGLRIVDVLLKQASPSS
jgi:hypothetical protein